MIRVDYHLHTGASPDCRTSTAEVLDRALAAGLDVVCVTDHDTIDGAVALLAVAPRALRVVVGCEFTCEDGSHVIGLGLTRLPAERRPLFLLDAIHAEGGRTLLPHPFRRGSGLLRPDARRSPGFLEDALARADAVECFNARDTWENNRRSHALASARGLPAVAGSDAHRAVEIGGTFVEYDGPGYADGRSPRRVWGPPQPPARELPLKRRALELYHAHERRLPPWVAAGYRALRGRLHRDGPRTAGAPPRIQHDLPALDLPAPPAAPAQARPGPPAGGGAPGAALAPAPGHRPPGAGHLAG